MHYLFPSRVVGKLNDLYQKNGSNGFLASERILECYHSKRLLELNSDYYKAKLLAEVYLTYAHLFGLKSKMRRIGFSGYWFNSVDAVSCIKLINKIKVHGQNVVEFMSSCFSSFYHQDYVYRHIYDYRLKDLGTDSHFKNTKDGFYYFSGNPLLDLAHQVFDNDFIHSPFDTTVNDITWNWYRYLNNSQKLLRMPEFQFCAYFGHHRDKLEKIACFKNGDLPVFVLLGLPDDSQCMSIYSDKYYEYTGHYHKNLIGYEDFKENNLEIPKYKLYNVNVAHQELHILKTHVLFNY